MVSLFPHRRVLVHWVTRAMTSDSSLPNLESDSNTASFPDDAVIGPSLSSLNVEMLTASTSVDVQSLLRSLSCVCGRMDASSLVGLSLGTFPPISFHSKMWFSNCVVPFVLVTCSPVRILTMSPGLL